jgi:hypothetical protein
MTRGRKEEAGRIVAEIERRIESDPGVGELPPVDRTIAIRPSRSAPPSRPLSGA